MSSGLWVESLNLKARSIWYCAAVRSFDLVEYILESGQYSRAVLKQQYVLESVPLVLYDLDS